jgi:catechol 2,3-dioxygenase-like lactoylglutathione lyase family enzyme
MSAIESLSAVTLAVAQMDRSTRFYAALGFDQLYGGPDEDFTSYRVGSGFLNLQLDPAGARSASGWGRPIFYVANVDATHRAAVDGGYVPSAPPADAPWGERYFHIHDPDGHEISFARLLDS